MSRLSRLQDLYNTAGERGGGTDQDCGVNECLDDNGEIRALGGRARVSELEHTDTADRHFELLDTNQEPLNTTQLQQLEALEKILVQTPR